MTHEFDQEFSFELKKYPATKIFPCTIEYQEDEDGYSFSVTHRKTDISLLLSRNENREVCEAIASDISKGIEIRLHDEYDNREFDFN